MKENLPQQCKGQKLENAQNHITAEKLNRGGIKQQAVEDVTRLYQYTNNEERQGL